mgnify:FL=1
MLTGFRNEDYFGFAEIDLTGITTIDLELHLWNSAVGGKVEARSQSPGGMLLGETIISGKPGRQQVSIDLQPTSGKQNIYFVFKNESEAGEVICNTDWVYFRNAEQVSLSYND